MSSEDHDDPVRPAEVSGGRAPVLFLHPSDEAYGADRILLELVEAALADGREVEVLLADDTPPGWLSGQLAARGVRVVRTGLAPARRRYLRPRLLPRFGRQLLAARRAVRAEARRLGRPVIHVNTSALPVGALLGRPGGSRVVWHVHEIVPGASPASLAFRILPALTADRVVAVSQATAEHLIRLPRGARIDVVPNGLPDEAPRPADLALPGPVVAFVGRLNHWKGYETFVAAAGQVLGAGLDASFVVAGGPPPGEAWRRADLDDRIAAVPGSASIHALGERPDGSAIIAAADVVVVPSRLPDPLPTVVLEAMRAGRPVIAAAHGGALEMVVDGTTGLLVAPGDPEALAGAIRRLVADAPLRAAMGAAGRQRFEARYRRARFQDAIRSLWGSL